MASQKQIEANRRNAMKSCGPKTSEGKIRSRANSLKHGLCASTITVIKGEDPEEYEALRAALVDTAEETATEPELVVLDQLAQHHWRGLRLRAQEKIMLETQGTRTIVETEEHTCVRMEDYVGATAISLINRPEKEWNNYFRYEAAISRDMNRTLDKLIRLQESRRRHEREMLKLQLGHMDKAASQEKPKAAAAGIGFVSSPPGNPAAESAVHVSPAPAEPEIGFVPQAVESRAAGPSELPDFRSSGSAPAQPEIRFVSQLGEMPYNDSSDPRASASGPAVNPTPQIQSIEVNHWNN